MARSFFESLFLIGPALALLLQGLVLSRFLDRRNRDYPIAIFFTLILFILTSVAYLATAKVLAVTVTYNSVYSSSEVVMHLVLLTLMLQLTSRTLQDIGDDVTPVWILGGLSVLVLIGASVFFQGSVNERFTKIRQVVSFWMVLLNLYWWTLLLRRRRPSRRALMLSAGIGLLMTGQTIGDGIFSIPNRNYALLNLGASIMYATHFACLYTWYKAFHPGNAKSEAPALAQSLKTR